MPCDRVTSKAGRQAGRKNRNPEMEINFELSTLDVVNQVRIGGHKLSTAMNLVKGYRDPFFKQHGYGNNS